MGNIAAPSAYVVVVASVTWMHTLTCGSFLTTACPPKLQALVYDILPSTTAVFSYAIVPENCQLTRSFFVVVVGAQTVVSLLQTAQIISDVCFITDHVAYASSNKAKIVWIETELSFLPGVGASHVYVRAWALGCFHSHTQTFRRVLNRVSRTAARR